MTSILAPAPAASQTSPAAPCPEMHPTRLDAMVEQSRSTAELIVECLENEGVTHVFGIPGEENIRLMEALSKSSIEYVLTRHEQGASFMAETYGRLTGKAGVCSATLGPGAINLLLGTADATTNSTPLIALSAQVGMQRSFKESHQGVDLVSMFTPATKWSALMATPGAAPLVPLRVTVPVPGDPSAEQVARAARILREARNPVVLAGHGAARAGASAALIRFAQALNIPVATTFHGKGVFPDDHPLALGPVGFMRHDYVNFGLDQADLIVAVGYELQEFNPVKINPAGTTRIIHVHRFPAEVDAHYDVAVVLTADISHSLDALAASVWRRSGAAGGERIRELLSDVLTRGQQDDRFP